MNNSLQPFMYNSQKVRAVSDDQQVWFVASDVARVLGYRDAANMIRRIDAEDRGARSVSTLSGNQTTTIISHACLIEANLYGKSESAKQFRKWVTHTVLPVAMQNGITPAPATAVQPTSRMGLMAAAFPAPLSVLTFDFRKRVALKVNELRQQELELDAAITDLTSAIREKRKQAFAKLNAARKANRAGKQSTVFTTASKNRFETAVFALNTSHWTMENPPRMAVLKTPGSGMRKDMVPEAWGNRGFWIDSAPSYKAFIGGSFEKLQVRYRVAFGEELDAPWGLQFQLWGNPHIHLWLCVPMNSDGTERLAASPTGRGARNAKYNGLRLWEWLELNWADILGIRSDITSPEEHGVATWLARSDEVDPADSMDDYLGRAVGYIRLDNDLTQSEKRHQQVVPAAWRDPENPQQVNFWGIAGFTNKRKAVDAPQRFEIHTLAALEAVIHYLGKISGQGESSKEIEGVEVNTSFWSPDRTRLRGGMLDGPRTQIEILELRRIISFFNKVEDARVDEELTAEDYREPVDAPHALNHAAYWMAAPAPWERPDFDLDEFIAAHDDGASYEPPMPIEDDTVPSEDETVPPITELLADWGVSPAEQAAVERTAVRKSGEAIDAAQFVFTDADQRHRYNEGNSH